MKCNAGLLVLISLFVTIDGWTQNPIVRDQFTADPSARVFNNKIYVYPSHDILAAEGKGRVGWFCMEDYHVFSSDNLTQWKDHGVIVTQNKVPWVKSDSYNMWAPDCIFRNGKYYFYFPATPKDTTGIGRGFTIGVAIADKPEGPFIPQPEAIKKVRGIDPNVFIDKNGDAYLYWSAGNIFGAKLKDNMVELDSEVKILADLPTKGLKEGPYVFERNGIYYLTYPHVENKTERLEYAIGDNPLGPFKVTGVIMDESPTRCWTNHHSILQFKEQWYLFYHHNDYSPKFDKSRSIRMDSLFFNTDGSIRKVEPTLRGVGLTTVDEPLQIDRYSAISKGSSIDLLDSAHTFEGWKTKFSSAGDWIRYNRVDFGSNKLKAVKVRAQSSQGSVLQVRTSGRNGMVLCEIKILPGNDWSIVKAPLKKLKPGVQDIVVELKKGDAAQVDWISFE
jgi:hypothetical protein